MSLDDDLLKSLDEIGGGYHFDRDGKPIKASAWVQLQSLPGYFRIATTHLPDGRRVSTIWTGLDGTYGLVGRRRPLIFETVVFGPECGDGLRDVLDCWRYHTEPDAIKGHRRVCRRLLRRPLVSGSGP